MDLENDQWSMIQDISFSLVRIQALFEIYLEGLPSCGWRTLVSTCKDMTRFDKIWQDMTRFFESKKHLIGNSFVNAMFFQAFQKMVILLIWREVSHKREISCCPAFVGLSFSLSDSTQIMQKNDFSLNDFGKK